MLVLLGLIMYGCVNRRSGAGYTEETAEIRDIVTFYSYSGNVDAKNKQNVISPGNNLSLDQIYVKAGDYVHVDDILYSLDSLDAENNVAAAAANVEIARINYEKARGVGKDQSIMQAKTALASATTAFNDAELNLERMQELFENEGISQADLEKAQTSYNNAKTQLESAQFNYDAAETQADQGVQSAKAQYDQAQANYNNALNAVENRKIRAEVEGTVSDVYAQANTTLSIGEKVMDIIDYNSLILEIRIDEYEMSAVSEGKKVEVYINALEKTITGTITNISNQAIRIGDLSYFTAEVLLDKSPDLRLGLSAEVKVPNISQLGIVTISLGALQFDVENKPFVFIGTAKNPIRQKVETGKNDGKIVEIIEGLKAGEIVLIPAQDPFSFMMGPQGGGARRQVNGNE